MKWCCAAFQGWFEHAGNRGLGVFVSTRGGPEPAFILQYRALDRGVPLPHTDSLLSSVSDVHIHFCPWCGSELRKWYRDDLRELDRSELQVSLQ
jgi:hypothetical protein